MSRRRLRARFDVVEVTAAEKRIKQWQGKWKLQLIETLNPEWLDLADQLH